MHYYVLMLLEQISVLLEHPMDSLLLTEPRSDCSVDSINKHHGRCKSICNSCCL